MFGVTERGKLIAQIFGFLCLFLQISLVLSLLSLRNILPLVVILVALGLDAAQRAALQARAARDDCFAAKCEHAAAHAAHRGQEQPQNERDQTAA